MSTSSIIPPAVEQATTPLSPERLAEIRARVEGLDHDRTFNGSTWKSAPVDSKSVLPPQQNFVVEDVLKTSDCVIRASVAVFADESLADFTAHARQDVPALLAEVDRLRLTPHERLILRFALEMADDAIASNPVDFTDEDTAALAKLRALSTGPTVAYRNPWQSGVLLCVEHGEGWAGMKPLSVEDLPNGGTCTAGDPANPDDVCGRNVLAPEAGDPR